MRAALTAMNALVSAGTVPSYAIGGAVAAAFYIEAVNTEDLDVFVLLPESSTGLASLSAVYQGLTAAGGVLEGAHIRFEDWPVQILSDANDLIAEAIQRAREVSFEGVPTRVFTAEHLCAIALQTGRAKDFFRVSAFLEQQSVDRAELKALVRRYGLQAAALRIPSFVEELS